MKKEELVKRIAYSEFVYDQLEAEMLYVDQLLKSVGFPKGISSAKEVALELLENVDNNDEQAPPQSKN